MLIALNVKVNFLSGLIFQILHPYLQKHLRPSLFHLDLRFSSVLEDALLHLKNFGQIVQFLERKTASECIQYYYLTKKNTNYNHQPDLIKCTTQGHFMNYRGIVCMIRKNIFLKIFLPHPKNLCQICAVSERKTASKCIQYYYLTMKNTSYKQLVHLMEYATQWHVMN